MSFIEDLERPIPVPNEFTKPFWDAANDKKLVVQTCTHCGTNHYPPKQNCDNCTSLDSLTWKEVKGTGHVDVFFVIRDSRIRGFQPAQPINFVLITLDEDPTLNFLSNLPGTPPGEVPMDAAVEVIFDESGINSGQLIPEWRVIH